jgi:ParB-like chromosome segregation protein Spo0J
VRVDIRDLTDDEAERLSLIENLQRENLTPLEEGYRYWQLQQRDPRQWSVRTIAEFVHKKKSTVQNRLGLVKEPAVAEAVLREQIPQTAGFHILRLPPPERESYLRAAVAQGLTVEQIKADVDRRLASQRAPVIVRLDRMRAAGGRGAEDLTDDERREALRDERREVNERIEAMERELRSHYQRLREIDHQLAQPRA